MLQRELYHRQLLLYPDIAFILYNIPDRSSSPQAGFVPAELGHLLKA
jgi:hypothetical protein